MWVGVFGCTGATLRNSRRGVGGAPLEVDFGAEGEDGGVGEFAGGGEDVLEVGFEGEEGGELESVESFDGGFAVVGCGGGGGGEVGPGGEEAEDVVGAGRG